MTKQETFNAVVAHLRKQGVQAMGKNSTCQYIAENGLKCAVGCLIPNDRYRPDFEGDSLMGADDGRLAELMEELGHDLDLLMELQDVHDNHAPHHWEMYLKDVADSHELIYAPA